MQRHPRAFSHLGGRVAIAASFAAALAAAPMSRDARAATTATCPESVLAECDGAGNEADREAWLAGFSATSERGCEDAVTSLTLVPGLADTTFRFPDFSDVSTLTLNGRASLVGNPVFDGTRSVLRLTDGLGQAASVFVSEPTTLADDASFSAYFAFRISAPVGAADDDGIGADGLVFVVQTVSDTAGASGGGIGYQGLPSSVGVEIDTWNNGAGDANDGNHVGIDIAGDVASAALTPVARRLNDGDTWHAWVDYDGATELLEVRLSLQPARPADPDVSHSVDLLSVLGSTRAFVGFTSGTGAAGGTHDVLSFFFTNAVTPSGCRGSGGAETAVFTAIDACGDVDSCTSTFQLDDREAPVVLVEGLACGDEPLILEAPPDGPDGAFVSVVGAVRDDCDPMPDLESTAGGSDASGLYPCGLSSLRFTARDACRNETTCTVLVRVRPSAPPPDVGPALRVRKDAAGLVELDWTRAGGGPDARWIVLGHDEARLARDALALGGWLDARTAPAPDLRHVSVRRVACDGTPSDE